MTKYFAKFIVNLVIAVFAFIGSFALVYQALFNLPENYRPLVAAIGAFVAIVNNAYWIFISNAFYIWKHDGKYKEIELKDSYLCPSIINWSISLCALFALIGSAIAHFSYGSSIVTAAIFIIVFGGFITSFNILLIIEPYIKEKFGSHSPNITQ